MKLHFVDIETSHLDHRIGEITEICIITEDTKTGITSKYYKKIKLQNKKSADPKSLEIGNYNEELWEKEGVYFSEVAEDICKILHDGIFVAHNVLFDYCYIKHYLQKNNYDYMTYKTFDTKDLVFEHLYKYTKSTSMKSCREFFGWSLDLSHTADKDTEDCRKLFHSLFGISFFKKMYYVLKFKWRSLLC
jgi:DNA polymerase III alpha subunit (gram-positive type)